ncbi:MAG TPA: IclR family transcriptional regulator [Rheinheimera sp.]|uniref:IclR family transcriptional regulator n=1 Tax=Rheinheimera sp. TaxID=1869214 RepID=UPI002B47DC62|nr:IclR family transcriptional regulator [Rheinheimera sp.]HJS13749.1 IclR family transcriptional regulator [Rheinheimera sp.]
MTSYLIPNLANACRMMELVAASGSGLTLSQLEQQLHVPRTSAFRILQTLCQQQMLYKEGKKYRVGSNLYKMGLDLLQHHHLHQLAVPVLHKLTISSGLTSHLALPRPDGALIAEVCDSPNPSHLAARPGFLADLHCSAGGKVFLAFNYFDQLATLPGLQQMPARTPQSITDLACLRVELQSVLGRGYAVDDQEYQANVRCIAVPIRNAQGIVVASVGVTGLTSILCKQRLPELVAAVKQAAIEISLACYRPALLANDK